MNTTLIARQAVKDANLNAEVETGGGDNQAVIKFSNGFGASLIQHSFSYGLEMAVIKLTSDEKAIQGFEIYYDAKHITEDVLGYLSHDDVRKNLELISNL